MCQEYVDERINLPLLTQLSFRRQPNPVTKARDRTAMGPELSRPTLVKETEDKQILKHKHRNKHVPMDQKQSSGKYYKAINFQYKITL